MKTRLKQELDFKLKMKRLQEVVKGITYVYRGTLSELSEKEKEISRYEILLSVIKSGRTQWDFMDDVLTYIGFTSEGFCDKLYPMIEGDKPFVSLEVNDHLVQFGFKD